MNAQDERDALMDMSREVMAELKAVGDRVRLLTAKLVEAGDSLLIQAMDEKQEGVKPSVKKVVYTGSVGDAEQRMLAAVTSVGRISSSTPFSTPMRLAAGKRACSACRQPGHRAGNPVCPMTQAAYEEPRGKGKKK